MRRKGAGSLESVSHRSYVLLALIIVISLVTFACGDDDTPTPAPSPTAESGVRPIEEWTEDKPATLEEIEKALENHRGESFVFTSWGGALQSAQRQAYITPFENKFGIDVIEDSPTSYSKVRVQAETGNLQWHVVDVSGDFGFGFQDAIDPLDLRMHDLRDMPPTVQDLRPFAGGGGMLWAFVFAYNTNTYPESGPQPEKMADFFDTESFPGRRAWPNYHSYVMRFALLANDPSLLESEVGRNSLSRLDSNQVDRAFDLLGNWSDQASIFYSSSSECPQLMIADEIDMCILGNARFVDAIKEGAAIEICWQCGFTLSTDFFIIPRGLKEQDPQKYELANLFIAWTAFPERNAQLSKYIAYTAINLKSQDLLDSVVDDPIILDGLPLTPSKAEFAIFEDEIWSGETFDALFERYLGEVME